MFSEGRICLIAIGLAVDLWRMNMCQCQQATINPYQSYDVNAYPYDPYASYDANPYPYPPYEAGPYPQPSYGPSPYPTPPYEAVPYAPPPCEPVPPPTYVAVPYPVYPPVTYDPFWPSRVTPSHRPLLLVSPTKRFRGEIRSGNCLLVVE